MPKGRSGGDTKLTHASRAVPLSADTMAEDNGGELKPHFITPQPILLETNVDKLLARSLPPPLPSPSLKPRKTSVSARASPIVAQVSAPSARKLSKAQQRKELMEGTGHASPPPPAQQQHGTEHKSLHDEADDDDDDFSRVRARSRRQGSQFDDVQPRRRATGGLPEPPNGSACGRGSPSSAASSPPTAGKNADSKMAVGGAQQQQQQRQQQQQPMDMPVNDEQAWHEFVLEENYSVLATKGILQRITEFNEAHKSIQILKMQNSAIEAIDSLNAEIHGMDQMEIERERERMGIKKKKSTRRVGKKGRSPSQGYDEGDGVDDNDSVDEEESGVAVAGSASGAGTGAGGGGAGISRSTTETYSDSDDFETVGSSTESTPEQSGGSSKGRRNKNKPPPKLKNFFKSGFIVQMRRQMKKHINELCKRDYPRVRFNGRCHVNFLHGEELMRKKEYVSEVTLKNIGVRTAHVQLQQFGTSPRDSQFQLSLEPKSFEIAKGKKQVVTVTLVVHSSRARVSEVVGVEIGWRTNSKEAKTKDKSGLRFPRRLCIYVSALGEPAVFGVPLAQVEMVPWTPQRPDSRCRGGQVPKVLVDLKEYLIRTGGLEQEGIFRKAPGDVETQQVCCLVVHFAQTCS